MDDQLQAEVLQPAPRNPMGHAPVRRAHSFRRTSSIDVTWPQGYGGAGDFVGVARDIITLEPGSCPQIVGAGRVHAVMGPDRVISDIQTEPRRDGSGLLVGLNGGSSLRKSIDMALPEDRVGGTPLFLLIDDLAGTSLIANWAWSRWTDDWLKDFVPISEHEALQARVAKMTDICAGFRAGSAALADVRGLQQNSHRVVPLPHPDDALGFHSLTEHNEVSMRRARRIDVWEEDGLIQIDSAFQDSASAPEGGRVAVHEYVLRATADRETMALRSVQADPRILPYRECPAAVQNVGRLVGTPLGELRGVVLKELRRTEGCTHLNDALRALTDIPLMVGALRANPENQNSKR